MRSQTRKKMLFDNLYFEARERFLHNSLESDFVFSFVFERASLLRFILDSETSEIKTAVGAFRKAHVERDVISLGRDLNVFSLHEAHDVRGVRHLNTRQAIRFVSKT